MSRLPALPDPRYLGPGVSPNHPEPGHWLIRLVRRGAFVPCRIFEGEPIEDIWWESSANLVAEILGEPASMDRVWHARRLVLPRLPNLTAEQEYAFRCAEHRWAKEFAPHEPIANPWRAVDMIAIGPVAP